jgi:hypothetical protein
MSLSPLALLSPSSRSLEWIVGPDALLSSTALSTGQLASLGPIASLVEGAVDPGAGDSGGSLLPDALATAANQIILTTHAQLEETSHQVAPLNGPVHGLTNLGETVGLGHIGEAGNLITDLSGAIANPTGSGAVAPVLSDIGHVAEAAGTLLESVTAAPAAGNGLVGSGSILTPATDILNQTVLDAHATLEDVGHQAPGLNTPIHALTGFGETVGLGHIGEAGNLVTDTLALPGSVLNGGGLASAGSVLGDLSHVLGSADTLLGSMTGLANAGGLLGPDGLLAPVTNLANTAVLDIHATLENLGHEVPLLNDSLHGLTNLGETLGLGHLGESGTFLTDAAGLPGALLGGQGLGAVSPVLGDLGAVTNAAGGLLGGVTGLVGDLGGSGTPAVGGLLAPITGVAGGVLNGGDGGGLGGTGALLGTNAPLQPVGNVANTVIDGLHAGLEQVGHSVPVLNDPLHAVIDLGNTAGLGQLGETGNLLTDVVNLPGAALTGNGAPAVGHIVGDVGHVADAAGGVLGSVTGILPSGAGAPGAGLPLDGALTAVTSVLGATDVGGAGGNLIGGVLGGLSGGGGAGTHPLVDVAAGPATATPVANLAVLTPAADPAHTVQVSAIGVSGDHPSAVTASLLSSDGIVLPQSSGGADQLVGQVLNAASNAAPTAAAGSSHDAHLDLGIVSIDLGGHTETHHVDPTPHTATSGLHLLGL